MSATDLVVTSDAAALEADPVQYMAVVLNRAKEWLSEAASIADVRETKAIAVGYESVIREKELAFDAQLSATEIVRRCERRIGELVEQGKRDGEIRTRADGGWPTPNSIGTTVPNKIGTDEIFVTHRERSDSYVMADAPASRFEQAITDAREEGNLSRANVVRKVKDEPVAAQRDKTMGAVQERYGRIREMAGEGHTSSQIAEELGYSEGGVRSITAKLGIDVPADASVGKARRIDANRVVEQTVMDLESQASSAVSLMSGRWGELDPTQIEGWVASLDHSLKTLRTFTKRLSKEAPGA